MSAALTQIAADPAWLAHRHDEAADAIHFVRADRALRRTIPFLTDEHLADVLPPQIVRRADVLASLTGAGFAPAPLHFIFHSAYCCSTLLANAFDLPGVASTLKEPLILNDMIGWQHRGAQPQQLALGLECALTLLARPFGAGEAVVIKPSNVVNPLAMAMMTMRPQARAILLYAPLPIFLASIAGKGLWGRLWVRELLAKLLRSGMVDLGFGVDDYFRQSDLQVAATGWLAQNQLFARMAAKWPDRVRIIDSETLLERPAQALDAAARLFGVPLGEGAIAQQLSTVFRQNAKFGGDFGRDDRIAEQTKAHALHADELDKVAIWAEAVARNAGLDVRQPTTLIS